MCQLIFKKGKIHRKQQRGNTMEKETEELDSMKAYKYLGVEENHD
jgi:hypothetical protein